MKFTHLGELEAEFLKTEQKEEDKEQFRKAFKKFYPHRSGPDPILTIERTKVQRNRQKEFEKKYPFLV